MAKIAHSSGHVPSSVLLTVELLHDETNASDVQEIGNRLQKNLERCLTYFTKFNAISKQCQDAEDSKDIQKNKRGIHPNTSYSSHFWSNTRL